MQNGLKIKIADTVFSIIPKAGLKGLFIDSRYADFITGDAPDIILEVKKKPFFSARHIKRFDALTWDYSWFKGKHIFRFSLSIKNKCPGRILILASDIKKGEIILPETAKLKNGFLQNPFDYPLDEILMISLLHRKQGLLIHSCGFAYRSKGYLFIGSSGAGKSTLARILQANNKGGFLLSDDRIIVRKKNGCFYAYGTPWHGDVNVCSPEKAPLKKIFFLKHAKENTVKKITPTEAISRLIVCSFPTFWDKKGMEFTLNFCAELAEKIPCYELGFVPDEGVLEFVKD